MKKLIPCMLAGFIIIGLFSVCITSFLAPSENYIQDNLEPSEDPVVPFYFVLNPESVTVNFGKAILLTTATNFSDCVYSWEVTSADHPDDWQPSGATQISGGSSVYFVMSRPNRSFYRCKAVRGDTVIYSAPCVVETLPNSSKSVYQYDDSQVEYLVTDFDKFYDSLIADIDLKSDFDKTVDIEESEVIE